MGMTFHDIIGADYINFNVWADIRAPTSKLGVVREKKPSLDKGHRIIFLKQRQECKPIAS